MMTADSVEHLMSTHVRIWPYVRGCYGRDILYRLWRMIEDSGDGRSLFWGSHDDPLIHGDLVAFVKFCEDPQRILLMITTRDGSDLAGLAWFDDVVPTLRAFGSIYIAPSHRGPFSEEAARLCLTYAFDLLNVESIWGITPWRAAVALCDRCGFERVTVLPAFTKFNDTVSDVTVLRLTKESFHGQHLLKRE